MIACVEGGYQEAKAVVFRRSKTGEEVRRICDPEATFSCVAFAPTKGGFALGCDTGDVQIWTARAKTPAATVGGLRDGVAALAFHPSQPVVVGASHEGDVAAWVREGRNWERLWYRAGPHYLGDRLIFSPDGTKVALIYDAHEGIHVYDMTRGATSDEVQGLCSPWHLFPGWNGLSVAEATPDATILRSPQTGGIIGRLPFCLGSLVLNREGNRLAGVLGRELHLYSVEVPTT
jgi:WD40 repeat protein